MFITFLWVLLSITLVTVLLTLVLFVVSLIIDLLEAFALLTVRELFKYRWSDMLIAVACIIGIAFFITIGLHILPEDFFKRH